MMSTNWQVGSDRSQPARLPEGLWEEALESLRKAKEKGKEANTKKSKKKQKPKGILLLNFTYSLKDAKFVSSSVERSSNLYFEYAVAMQEDVSNEYMVVQLDDEDLQALEGTEETRTCFGYDVDPLREMILRNGILVDLMQDENMECNNSILYHLIGCSNSQVQRHCYIFRRSKDLLGNQGRILKVLPNLLKLEAKKGIPKRVKYAGLLFSGITPVQLPKDLVVEELSQKYERNGFDFTDGPGVISRKLAVWVKQQMGLGGAHPPSIFQIRYCGLVDQVDGKSGFVCKGVLVVDPTNDDTYKIQVRKSMLKIQASSEACSVLQYTLGICDHSRPSPGRLGQQMACLLSGNVDRRDLIRLQQEHSNALSKALEDPFWMAWVLALDRRQNVWQNFHKLLLAEMKGSNPNQQGEVPKLYKKSVEAVVGSCEQKPSPKVQLPLAASRTLFGAVLPELLHDLLDEGECIVLLEDGPLRPKVISDENFVIVSRSPSYFPGDIRVLRVVSLPEDHPINSLRNCILFSTRGERPDPDKMGGGDLDGDKYLVVWHPCLLKYSTTLRTVHPASYDDNGPQGSGPPRGDWIHYAAQTDNAMLGAVESTFYKLAKQSGVDSVQIAELNSLFASLVDRHPTSLDAFEKLKGSLAGPMSSTQSVWEEMSTMQKECADSLHQKNVNSPQSGDLRQLYKKFQEACRRWDARLFSSKATNELRYHFLETLRSSDITETMAQLKALPARANGTHIVPKEDATSSNRHREINASERKMFSQFEERAHKLFAPSIREQTELSRPYLHAIHKHESRKEKICRERDEEMATLEARDKALSASHDEATQKYNKWSESRRQHWESLKSEQIVESTRICEGFRTKKRRQEQHLERLSTILNDVNQELGSLWYVLEAWSETKREAAKRKEIVLQDIEIAQREKESLEQSIQREKDRLQRLLFRHEKQAQVERKMEEKKQGEYISQVEAAKGEAARSIEACNERFNRLISGREKKDIEKATAFKREELKSLRELQSLPESESYNGNRDTNHTEVNGTVDVLMKEVKESEAQMDSMFCPQTLAEARDSFNEKNEMLESLKMGKSHVLHKVAQARLKWASLLQSGMLTSTQELKEWKGLRASLERVFALEENRLLGFPRQGVRNGPMPVYPKRSLLRDLLRDSQALVITAGTGCGKSTQIPQYVADDFYSYREQESGSLDAPVRIVCTQPRRVAARGVAERVAEEYKTKLGELVGFKVGSRGRSREECVQISENTIIEFVTEGLLLHNITKSSGFLKRYDCVIIDEMHERNAEQDLCLSLLRDYLHNSKVSRPSFKLVVMSASINADRFCQYLGNCPSLDCPGRMHPVQEVYLPPESSDGMGSAIVAHAVDVLFEQIVSREAENDGDVLIFLSGRSEIEECVGKIQQKASENSDLVAAYPLFSQLDQESISAARNPNHRLGLYGEMLHYRQNPIRKVICSTNMAETSLTIDKVRFVVDSGLSKQLRYDHSLRCPALIEDAVSHASTIQRKGRAGRTNSGTCFYLYSEHHHKEVMRPYDIPQIMERPIDELIILSLSVCGRSIEEMGLLDSPALEDVQSAKERLFDLGFIEMSDEGLCLTSDGRVAAGLPLRPESVRMVLHACDKFPHCLQKAINLSVLLSTTESIFDRNRRVHVEDKTSPNVFGDHLLALEHLVWFEAAFKTTKKGKVKTLRKKCEERGVNFKLLQSLQQDVETCHKELKKRKILPSLGSATVTDEEDSLLRVLVAGYFHHLVTCMEPEFMDRTGCAHVSIPSLSVFLDRQSFLKESIVSNQSSAAFIDDNDEGMECPELATDNNSGDGNKGWDLSIAEETGVKPCFLIYGNLKKITKINKTFMLDASVVVGAWIAEETPKRWLERVSFNPCRENLCRVSVKHIGPSFLRTEQDFFEIVKVESGVDVLQVSLDRNLIRLSGAQTSVHAAKAAIQEKLLSVMNQRRRSDNAHNAGTGLVFGLGMEVKGQRRQRRGQWMPLYEIFRAGGTNDRRPGALQGEARHGNRFADGRANTSMVGYHEVAVHGFERYQVRRFASVLSELRKSYPAILLCLVDVKTSNLEESIPKDEAISDYGWLTQMVKTKSLQSIRICFATQPREKVKMKSILNERLSRDAMLITFDSPTTAPKGCEWKQCVMCRRHVLVRFGKHVKVGKAASELEGFNLTICGCTYCRECFAHGVTETLQDELTRAAQCLCCKRTVLAKDCFEILGLGSEWNQLCRHAEANYCRDNLPSLTSGMRCGNIVGRRRGWATCPDCGVPSVFANGYYFFNCRNPRCQSKMCTRCCQVVTSREAIARCVGNECKPCDN